MSFGIGETVFIALISVWLIVAVISNVLVILTVVKQKKMRSVTNMLICNLAISDIFFAGIVLPHNLHDISHTEDFYEGPVSCKLVNFLPVLCVTASIYSLVAMAFERHRAIATATSWQITLKMSGGICGFVWILAFLVGTPTLFEYSIHEEREENTTHYECGSEDAPRLLVLVNGYFLLLVAYIIPLLAICINYGRLASFIIKRSRAVTPADSAHAQTALQTSFLSKRKLAIIKMLVIVAILFAVSWLPYFTLLIIAKLTGRDQSTHFDGAINMMRITISVFSASYNPALYVIYNTHFRLAFRKYFCCLMKRPEDDDSNNASTVQAGTSNNNKMVSHRFPMKGQ